jgi:dTMP kinase
MDMEWVIQANALAAKLLKPDLTVFIDVGPDKCIERINKSRSEKELYETLDNLKKVREKYFEAFDKLKEKENIFITDGHLDAEMVAKNIWEKVKTLI